MRALPASAAATASFAGPRIARMQSLQRVTLFAELDPDDLLDLTELAREEEVPAGGFLCEQGRPDSGDLFVVRAGRAAVAVRTGEGEWEVHWIARSSTPTPAT